MGRARNPIIGDTLARLLHYAGDKVATEYYVNDMGRQAATLAYGLSRFPSGDNEPRHPSQLYEAFLEGVVLFVILYFLSQNDHFF